MHQQQLRSGTTAFQAKGHSCQPVTLQVSWSPLATTQARGHPYLPLCAQHLWIHHKREHIVHTGGNLGAPGSGGQWRLHFWALPDILYKVTISILGDIAEIPNMYKELGGKMRRQNSMSQKKT